MNDASKSVLVLILKIFIFILIRGIKNGRLSGAEYT